MGGMSAQSAVREQLPIHVAIELARGQHTESFGLPAPDRLRVGYL